MHVFDNALEEKVYTYSVAIVDYSLWAESVFFCITKAVYIL